jgi:hypothetical protein
MPVRGNDQEEPTFDELPSVRAVLRWIRLHPGYAVLLLIIGVFVMSGISAYQEPPRQPETSEQIEARHAAEARSAELRRQAAVRQQQAEELQRQQLERDKNLCRVQSVCAKYSAVRQECATAGNFENCIRVKMGDGAFMEIGRCANDGTVYFAPANMPSRAQCFFFRLLGE